MYQSWVPAPVLLNCRCKRSVSKSHVRPSMLPATRHTAALTFQKVIHDANGKCLRVTYLGLLTPFSPFIQKFLNRTTQCYTKESCFVPKTANWDCSLTQTTSPLHNPLLHVCADIAVVSPNVTLNVGDSTTITCNQGYYLPISANFT
jgi:hypothetical protein